MLHSLKEVVYHPPVLFWICFGLSVIWAALYRIKEMLLPIINSYINALAESAKSNSLLALLAFSLALSASLDTFADNFANLLPKDYAEAGWWQVAALVGKSLKPFFSTIAALLVNPPAIKAASGTAKELAKSLTAPPFPVANPTDPAKPPSP